MIMKTMSVMNRTKATETTKRMMLPIWSRKCTFRMVWRSTRSKRIL